MDSLGKRFAEVAGRSEVIYSVAHDLQRLTLPRSLSQATTLAAEIIRERLQYRVGGAESPVPTGALPRSQARPTASQAIQSRG